MNTVCTDDDGDGDCLSRVLLSHSSNSGVIIPPLLVKMIALVTMVMTRIQMKLMTFKDKNDDAKTLKVDTLEHRIVFDQAEPLSFQADHCADHDHRGNQDHGGAQSVSHWQQLSLPTL